MELSHDVIQWINPILILITLLLTYTGYKKGFLSKLLSLFSFIVIVFIAYYLAPMLAESFEILPQSWAPYQDGPLKEFFYTQANQWFIFALVVGLTFIILFIIKPIVLLIGELPLISIVNRLLGFIFGLAESLLMVFVLLIILHTPFISNGKEVINSTWLYYVDEIQNELFGHLNELTFDIPENIDEDIIHELKNYLEEYGISDDQISSFLESQVNGNE